MGFFSFLKGKKEPVNESDIRERYPELIDLVDALSTVVGERFSFALINDDCCWYLSRSKVIGIMPHQSFPPYKSGMDMASPDELSREGDLIGIEGGTVVDSRIFDQVTETLKRENIGYTIWVRKNRTVPMIISTEKGNITIAPVIEIP